VNIFRIFLFTLALLASLPAAAQTPAQDRAPYETALSQLAEILGALHYLRPLCGATEQGQWRNEMQALLDAAQLPGDKRNLLVTSFNRGYVAYEQTYRSCTPAASLAVRRFLDEGARLSRDIATRYST
jgi:uncharacterized protein (TIGR02301 family)